MNMSAGPYLINLPPEECFECTACRHRAETYWAWVSLQTRVIKRLGGDASMALMRSKCCDAPVESLGFAGPEEFFDA